MKKILALSSTLALVFVSTNALNALVVHADDIDAPDTELRLQKETGLTLQKDDIGRYVTTMDKDYTGTIKVVGADSTIINQYITVTIMDGDKVEQDITLEPKDDSLTAEYDLDVKEGQTFMVRFVRTMVPDGVSVPYTFTYTDQEGNNIVTPLTDTIEHEAPSTDGLIDMTASYGFSDDNRVFKITDTSQDADAKEAALTFNGTASDGPIVLAMTDENGTHTLELNEENNYETIAPINLYKGAVFEVSVTSGNAKNTTATLTSTYALKNPIMPPTNIANEKSEESKQKSVLTTYYYDIDTSKELGKTSMEYEVGVTVAALAKDFNGYTLIGSHQQDIAIIDGVNEAVFYYKSNTPPSDNTPPVEDTTTDSIDKPTNNVPDKVTPESTTDDTKTPNRKPDTSIVPTKDKTTDSTTDTTTDSTTDTTDSEKLNKKEAESEKLLPQAGTNTQSSRTLKAFGFTGLSFGVALLAFAKRRMNG